jgi:peptide/nickel transport system ATP-binding protein
MASRIGFGRQPGTPLDAIGGTVPAPSTRPTGCNFAPRCPMASNKCAEDPQLIHHGPRAVACHFSGLDGHAP